MTAVNREFKKNKLLFVSFLAVLLLILIAALAPTLSSFDPNFVDLPNRLKTPGTDGHILGTDGYGRDLLARILYGGRVSLGLSVCVVLTNAFIGMVIGSFAAYKGGIIDNIIMRVIDVLMSFPSMILTLFIIGVLGSSIPNLFFSIIILGWVGYARMARSIVLSIKEQVFVQAAKSIGCNDPRILFCHVIPNVLPTIAIYGAMHIGSTMLSVASISYLGLGVQPPMSEWGTMLSDAKQYVSLYPHMIIYPGVAIAAAVFSFNCLGDGLRDLADPHAKEIIKT